MKFGQKMQFFFFETSKPLSLRIVLQLFQCLVCKPFCFCELFSRAVKINKAVAMETHCVFRGLGLFLCFCVAPVFQNTQGLVERNSVPVYMK